MDDRAESNCPACNKVVTTFWSCPHCGTSFVGPAFSSVGKMLFVCAHFLAIPMLLMLPRQGIETLMYGTPAPGANWQQAVGCIGLAIVVAGYAVLWNKRKLAR